MPPPLAAAGVAQTIPAAIRLRELRRDPAMIPGGVAFPELVRRFLPFVYGVASALIPEQPQAAQEVASGVFKTLAFRWKRIGKGTFLIRWLLRTTLFLVAKERKRLRLPKRSTDLNGRIAERVFGGINNLRPKIADAVLLNAVLGEPVDAVAKSLRTKPHRVEKRVASSIQRLARRVRKLGKRGEPEVVLQQLSSYLQSPPLDAEEQIIAALATWTPKAEREPLVRTAIWWWRRRSLALAVRNVLVGFGAVVTVLLLFVGTMAVLIKTGRVNPMEIGMWFDRRQKLKEFPEMAQRAKAWPTRPEELALISRGRPETSADLYATTNIWPVRLKFTREQWKAMKPNHIAPMDFGQAGGRIPLRNPKAHRSGLAGAIGIDFEWSGASLEFAGVKYPRVGVRYRGNGTFLDSQYGPKQSLKVDINHFAKHQQLAGVTTLNLINSIPDFSYVKDAMAERLFRELGCVAPRTAYAYVTIDAPGEYPSQPLGLYVMVENIDGNFAKDRFGTKAAPIFKPVTYELFADWGKDWSKYKEIYDLKTKATAEQLQRVVDMAQLVSHASDAEFAEKLPEFLDLEEYAAFVAGHTLMSSYDGYFANGQNFYMYLDPRSNKFGFISWDQDHGWGEFPFIDNAEHREEASIWEPWCYDNKFLKRVMKVDAFRKIYRAKLEQALAGPFTVEHLYKEVDEMAKVVRPAVAAESDFRLKRFELAVSDKWAPGPRNSPNQGMGAGGPKAPPHQMKRFIENRIKSVRAQLDGKSEGVRIRGFSN